MEEGKTVKFVFDGCDRWLRLCWYAMGIDKRATEVKQMPMKWGKRNTEYENLIEKVTDGLECDRYFITHMKDVYEHNNPNPVGRTANIKESTMDKMNQVIEVSRFDVAFENPSNVFALPLTKSDLVFAATAPATAFSSFFINGPQDKLSA